MTRQASSRLSAESQAIMDGQTAVKQLGKELYLKGETRLKIEMAVSKEIERTIAEIKDERLKKDTQISLARMAARCYDTLRSSAAFGDLAVLWAVVGLKGGTLKGRAKSNAERLIMTKTWKLPYGTQVQQRLRHYWKDVRETVDKLASERALDESDAAYGERRQSMRATAEIMVRQNRHIEEVESLKKRTKLVIGSTHADCSDRCAPYQGRVYSLDGTSGTTADGRKYVPLEEATNNPRDRYVTKAGRVYQNGFIYGFNCYDDQTEIYTDKGWKKFAELDRTEKVLTLNTATRDLEWQKPTAYYEKEWNGDMVYLHNQNTNLCITPDHNCLYYTQRSSELRFRPATELSTSNYLYAGCEWQGEEPKTIELGGKQVDSELYCKFFAYYLADGSKHSNNAVKIAQTHNDEMYNELKALPFNVWHDDNKIIVYSKEIVKEFAKFGHAEQKYIPERVKGLSRRLLNVFLDAYVKTDGYVAKHEVRKGSFSYHRSVFTTSKRMAEDLGEIALKAGLRPKFDLRNNAGQQIQFRNGLYAIDRDLYIIHLNWRTAIVSYRKDLVHYDGKVYCVEVPNHTLYVRRRGQTVWCGNCRHYLIEYADGLKPPTVNEKQRKKEVEIDMRQRKYEREIIRAKEKAIANKDIDNGEYRKWNRRARELMKEYAKFSHDHGRPYYRSRVQLI